ncbi:sterile alpha motif (SAM) domain-containing protein [Striga asiatica]|uniref:Sterile alpha motif (SAM) domain-containing protein n=1 Tax=Striga asiatica TaxID=4170 RepID=A0A5A7PQ76_STRAF|nr:sterile alpha motif (SAM) domain-containing protein [Striga asiatica]
MKKTNSNRKADRDVSCAKRVKMILPTSNQPHSSDDIVEECPRTRRVKSTIKHKGDIVVDTNIGVDVAGVGGVQVFLSVHLDLMSYVVFSYVAFWVLDIFLNDDGLSIDIVL